MLGLRKFMFDRVYLGEAAQSERRESTGCSAPCSTTWSPSPPAIQSSRTRPTPSGSIDYVAGMTDRYAIRCFERLSVPQGF